MYNRYVPQPDGSFKRSRVPEPEVAVPRQEETAEEPTSIPKSEPVPHANMPPAKRTNISGKVNRQRKLRQESHREATPGNVTSFLKQLLPGNFDTEDLIVVLLLLLMSGNTGEDRNNALLTLAIYLFL